MDTSCVTFEKHAPERRRKAVTTLHCGCTCCCCCCLHTIGSIVCAAVAPAIGAKSRMPLTYYWDDVAQEEIPLTTTIKKPGLSAVTVFWWVSCFLIFVCFAIGIVSEGGRGESLLITGVLVLLFFPIMQLIAAVITLIVFACWPRYDKMYQLKQLGKIAGGVVLGTIVGVLAMTVIGFAIAAINK